MTDDAEIATTNVENVRGASFEFNIEDIVVAESVETVQRERELCSAT